MTPQSFFEDQVLRLRRELMSATPVQTFAARERAMQKVLPFVPTSQAQRYPWATARRAKARARLERSA